MIVVTVFVCSDCSDRICSGKLLEAIVPPISYDTATKRYPRGIVLASACRMMELGFTVHRRDFNQMTKVTFQNVMFD